MQSAAIDFAALTVARVIRESLIEDEPEPLALVRRP